MIFTFSGTGNSQWAAEQLAIHLFDQIVSISDLRSLPDLQHEKQIGLVFPVYAWGLPEPVLSFVKKLTVPQCYTFAVCTCGEEAGLTMRTLNRIFPIDSAYSLIMPNNYILGSDLEEESVIRQKIQEASFRLQTIAREIEEHHHHYQVHEGSMKWFKSKLIHFGFIHFACSVKPFYTTDACNGCGLCAQHCPAKAIVLVNQKPVWHDPCFQCLRCLHHCPQAAIQYGKNTEKKGRYRLQSYLSK